MDSQGTRQLEPSILINDDSPCPQTPNESIVHSGEKVKRFVMHGGHPVASLLATDFGAD